MLSFQTRQEPLIYGQSALLVSPNGDIDDRSVHQFEQQLQDYFNVGYRFLVLNCAAIRSVNSTGLEVLLKMIETFQEAGGIFLLMQVQVLPQISKFFDMLGFSPIFTSFTNKQEASSYLITQIKAAFEASGEAGEKTSNTSAPATLSLPKSNPPPDTRNIMTPQHPPTPVSASTGITTPTVAANPVTSSPAPIQAAATNAAPLHISPVAASADSRAAGFKKEPKLERRILGSVTFDTQVVYYRRMYPFGVYPLTVSAHPTTKGGQNTIQITPHFPGCLVVPPLRIFQMQDKAEAKFWVTPLACKPVEGWVEFGKGEDGGCYFTLPCKIGKQTVAKWLALFAVVMAGLLQWPGFPWPHVVQYLRDLVAPYAPPEYMSVCVGSVLLFISAVACFINLPSKTKALRQVVLQK
jgi:anti-sigma B factor antagonist